MAQRFLPKAWFIALLWAKCRNGTDGGRLWWACKLAYIAHHRLPPSKLEEFAHSREFLWFLSQSESVVR